MSRPLRLLKFDSCHPFSYLAKKQEENKRELEKLTYEEYYQWLMARRVGLSDFLTSYWNCAGWVAREVIGNDDLLLGKLVESGHFIGPGLARRLKALKQVIVSTPLRDLLVLSFKNLYARRLREQVLACYIRSYQPDVILVREPSHLDGGFFGRFKKNCVLASFIGCNTSHPINWDPFRSDLIFTLTEEYFEFFRVQGIDTARFSYGVDQRIVQEVGNLPKVYDCTFVGYLGQPHQLAKTELLERVASSVAFKWWGVAGVQLSRFPALERSYQGQIAGIDMYRTYRQSKIVLNDYVQMNAGRNVNMRTKEVMNVGSMLLTRRAANIEALESEGALVTFSDAEECLAKIRHYLGQQAEREAIAAKGLQVALREFNYRDISAKLMGILESKVKECGRSWS